MIALNAELAVSIFHHHVWIFLAGFVGAALVVIILLLLRRRGVQIPGFGKPGGYKKVLVAAISRPFSEAAISLALEMAGARGVIETLYVVEVPIDRPLDVEVEPQLNQGMDALEDASRLGRNNGKRLVPRLERSRQGSRTIVELQRRGEFDGIVLELRPGAKSERVDRKIAEYIQENATCPVVVITGK